MTEMLERAVELLDSAAENTLAVCAEEKFFVSTERGIAPLLKLAGEGETWKGAYAADRIVGKAAAMLYTLIGVKAVYAAVLSESAKEVLEKYRVEYEYGTLTDTIINRMGTGLCPMEEAVREIDDPEAAVEAIRQKVAELRRR